MMRIARWLWKWLSPARVRDDVLGDLDEEYRRYKRRELGVFRAGLWYAYQVAATLVVLFSKYRSSRAPRPLPPGSDRTPSWSTIVNTVWQDVHYSMRSLRKAPGFTVVAVATLAMGIGANSAIFSVLNAVVLAPLPYDRPDELVVIGGHVQGGSSQDLTASGPEYRDYRDQASSLSALAAAYVIDANITNGERPERMALALTTPNFFSMLGYSPAVGRDFTTEDAGVDIGYVMVLSHAAWQRMFAGDPSVLGRTVQLDEDPITVVGVMPASFTHPGVHESPIEAWVPFDPTSDTFGNRRYRPLDLYGRLTDGVSVAESRTEFRTIANGLREAYPDAYGNGGDWTVGVMPLLDEVVGNGRATLFVLFGSVVFVLLIACTNVANLVLTRGTTRARELAVRSAIGGSRGRLAQQLLSESLMLALVGGAVGLLLARAGVDVLRNLAAVDFPRIRTATIDGPVLLFTLGVSVAASILFGLAPTWRLSKPDFRRVLTESGRGGSAVRGRVRDGLVVAQISISLVLVISAGLMVKSFARLLAVDPGFDPQRVLAMQVWLPRPNIPENGRFYRNEQRITLFDRAIEEMEAMPGVTHAAVISHLPLRSTSGGSFELENMDTGDRREAPTAEVRFVSPRYFDVMSIPLVQGRGIEMRDDADAPRVVVIDRAIAERYAGGQDLVGRRLRFGDGAWREIVGVVGSVRQQALDVGPRPTIYLPYRQQVGRSMTFVLKTAGSPDAMVQPATEALQSVDPDLPVYGVATMEDVIGDTVGQRRMLMVLLSLFAVQALLLAGIGVYGVIAYTTRQRNREIGIRMALGATQRTVVRMVLHHGLRLGLLGALIGLAAAAGVTHVLQGFLFEVGRLDPIVFVAMALLAVGVAALAAFLPARRATRVHPVEVLREI